MSKPFDTRHALYGEDGVPPSDIPRDGVDEARFDLRPWYDQYPTLGKSVLVAFAASTIFSIVFLLKNGCDGFIPKADDAERRALGLGESDSLPPSSFWGYEDK